MLNGLGKYSLTSSIVGERKIQVRASEYGGSSSGGGFRTSGGMGSASSNLYHKPILEDLINDKDIASMRKLYRDIYWYDPIAGSAVDLQSALPFSDFTLSGLPDQNMLRVFAKSLEAINVKTLLPELSVDYQVEGEFIAVANLDNETKSITSVMPQNPDACDVREVPIYGHDPIIDITLSSDVKALINSKDPRIQEMLNKYGDALLPMSKQNKFPLDPKYTLYIARRTFSTQTRGTSYYKRIIPIWLWEKALLRGTIDLSYRRQKSILHLILGDQDWEPTNEEMEQVVNMFISADRDPTGAVIATRPGITTSEVRTPSDFWRYDEIYDSVTSMKLRALGISEALLSGDASYSNLEASISVYLEQVRSYRELITRKLFYQRLFPLIAVENNFMIQGTKVTSDDRRIKVIKVRGKKTRYEAVIGHSSLVTGEDGNTVDLTQYYSPKINWHKPLKPEADSAYMDMLTILEERGLPIPLRIWATAGGLPITDIMQSLTEDVQLRKKVNAYKKQLPKSAEEQAAGMFAGASAKRLSGGPRNREFNTEIRDPDTKTILSRKGRKVFEEKFNKKAANALSNVASIDNKKEQIKAQAARQRLYHYHQTPSIFGNT